MKISLTRLVIASVAGISAFSLLLPQSSLADQLDPLQELDPQQSNDPFSRTNEESSFGLFDLIHRANLGSNSIWDTTEQNEKLDAAAAEFLAKQRQLLQNQQPTNQDPQILTPQVDN